MRIICAALTLLLGMAGAPEAAHGQRLTEQVFPKFILRLAEPGELAKIRDAINRGDAETASELILGMIDADPDPSIRYAAQNAMCVLYTKTRDYDLALEACDEAIAITSSHWMALNSRGTVYYQMGRLDRAEADYRRAEELAPAQSGRKIVTHNLDLIEQRQRGES